MGKRSKRSCRWSRRPARRWRRNAFRLVLDSNEYIIGIDSQSSPHPLRLLRFLTTQPDRYEVYASRVIQEEVRRNLPAGRFQEFWAMLNALDVSLLEDWEIPESARAKYEAIGLKPGDAAIAACAEVARAEVVVTENRDFHGRTDLPFRPLRAEEFLREQGVPEKPV